MEPEGTAEQLRKILASIVCGGEGSRFTDASQIDIGVQFADMGINSIDLMEFVLAMENHFDIALIEETQPNEEPATLAQWAKLVDRSLRVTSVESRGGPDSAV